MELFDKQFRVVRTYTLFGVWVQSLGDVAYDVKDTGQIQTIQATLAYQFWRSSAGGARSGARSGGAALDASRPYIDTNPNVSVTSLAGQPAIKPNSNNWPNIPAVT